MPLTLRAKVYRSIPRDGLGTVIDQLVSDIRKHRKRRAKETG